MRPPVSSMFQHIKHVRDMGSDTRKRLSRGDKARYDHPRHVRDFTEALMQTRRNTGLWVGGVSGAFVVACASMSGVGCSSSSSGSPTVTTDGGEDAEPGSDATSPTPEASTG